MGLSGLWTKAYDGFIVAFEMHFLLSFSSVSEPQQTLHFKKSALSATLVQHRVVLLSWPFRLVHGSRQRALLSPDLLVSRSQMLTKA